MANPKQKLDWFPVDTRILESPKVRKLVHRKKVVGYGIFLHVLGRIYLNGYFIKDNIDSFSEDIAYDLGYSDSDVHIEEVKDVIKLMLDVGLLDKNSYEYESVFTSKAIQVQFVKSTLRRKPQERLYWLLTPEEEADIKAYLKTKKEEENRN